jgi:hypothetical protein
VKFWRYVVHVNINKLFPDKPDIYKVIFFLMMTLFGYPILILGAINQERFFYFSSLFVSYLFSISSWLGMLLYRYNLD